MTGQGQNTSTAVMQRDDATTASWAARITACWRSSVESVLQVGGLLTEAKAALPHGEFGAMIERELPFTARTAQMLMAIFADPRLSNPKHVSLLPPSWGTLYELTKLSDDQFDASVSDGTIRPDMERRDIGAGFKQEHRATRERELGENQRALPDKKYGVIYADPEWRFEPYSRSTGMDRAPENHYPTSELEAICARPVRDIVAPDCVLFLWATVPMLAEAFCVLDAWGFARFERNAATGFLEIDRREGKYVSSGSWTKYKPGAGIGMGHWFRVDHEILLVATRGHIPAPAKGTQARSVFDEPASRVHSQKPQLVYELIEKHFPNLPKIELNARTARAGWDSWGNEAPELSIVSESELDPAALNTAIARGETSGVVHDAPPPVSAPGGASTVSTPDRSIRQAVSDKPGEVERAIPDGRLSGDTGIPAAEKGCGMTILRGDCRTDLAPHGPFDLLIADLPYGDTSLHWDRRCGGWIEAAASMLKATGSLWVFGSMRLFQDTGADFKAAGLQYAQDVVWEKHNGSGFRKDRFKRVHEHACQYFLASAPWALVYNEVQKTSDATARTIRRKRPPPHMNHIDPGHFVSHDGGPRLMRSVIYMRSRHGRAIHETEKPSDLIEILIRTSCPPHGIVGDMFAGSGAACEAAMRADRRYAGTEIDPAMATKANDRVSGLLRLGAA